MQLIEARAQLVRPKPSFAFGLCYDQDTREYTRLRRWQHASNPPVDAFVASELPVPFFLVESKSNNGSRQTGENQLANGMIQAHDVLCSLGVEDRLFVFGAVQVSYAVTVYISFSTSHTKKGKTFTNNVSDFYVSRQ